jgi:hypothetical protein
MAEWIGRPPYSQGPWTYDREQGQRVEGPPRDGYLIGDLVAEVARDADGEAIALLPTLLDAIRADDEAWDAVGGALYFAMVPEGSGMKTAKEYARVLQALGLLR